MIGASAGETLTSEQSKGRTALVATGFTGGCSRSTLSGLIGRIMGSLPDREGTEIKNFKKLNKIKINKTEKIVVIIMIFNKVFYTCWDSEKSCGCLWAAHAVLRHALVHAIILRPDVEHTQHLWGHPMAWRRAQWLRVVEPHHSGSGLAPHLTAETHRVAPCNVLLLQLDTHLGWLWKTKEGNFRKMSQNMRKKKMLQDGLAAQNMTVCCRGVWDGLGSLTLSKNLMVGC